MIRARIPIILIIFLFVLAGGCEPVSEDNPSGKKGRITLNGESQYTVPSEGGTVIITFSASRDWTAALSPDSASGWLTLSPASGSKKEGTLTVKVAPNGETDDRSATVRLSCGASSASVTITQKQKGALAMTPSAVRVRADGGSFEVEITTNVDVNIEITAGSDWLSELTTKSLSTQKHTFKALGNESQDRRKGEIVFRYDAEGLVEKLTVTQLGKSDADIPDDAFRAWLLGRFDTDNDGILSKEECAAVKEMAIGDDIPLAKSLSGIRFFPHLSEFSIRGTAVEGTADFSDNKELKSLFFENDACVEGIVIGSDAVDTLYADGCSALKEVVLPDAEFLPNLRSVNVRGTSLPSLDLSPAPALKSLDCLDCPLLTDVYLRIGTKCEIAYDQKITTIHYIGDELDEVLEFEDPVFKKILVNLFDKDENNEISKREALNAVSLEIDGDVLRSVLAEGDTLRSFKGISHFENLEEFSIYYYSNSRQSLAGRVRAEFIDEFASLQSLKTFSVVGDTQSPSPNLGFYGSIPEGMGDLPELEYFGINGCPVTGTIPANLVLNKQTRLVDVRNCSLSPTHVTVPSSELPDHPERGAYSKAVYAFDQYQTEWRNNAYYLNTNKIIPGNLTYRSDVDGTGPVHPDGELVLYHKATKGEGVNLILTGDGFTEANNTVEGTLETYMAHSAETLFNQDPFNKLRDYFNVYFLFAHSVTEGIGTTYFVDSNDETGQTVRTYLSKFRSRMRNPAIETTCSGNDNLLVSFIRNAGLDPALSSICVIMNAQDYAGCCYFWNNTLYGQYSICYLPVGRLFELTFLHEFGGHGFGRLADEYDGANAGYDRSSWEELGRVPNIIGSECGGDPDKAPWAAFINDGRYADEDVGLYKMSSWSGLWRSSRNSIMRIPWDEGGDRFNVPSRESIYLFTMFISGASSSSWSSWKEFHDQYDREDFVAVDKQAAPPSDTPRRAPVRRLSPVLSNGFRMPDPPLPTPPVFVK
jgi:hypothetical protein